MKRSRSRRKQASPHPSGDAGTPPEAIGGHPTDLRPPWLLVPLALATWLLSLPMFEPGSVWAVGYILLVPWLVGVCLIRSPGWTYVVSFLLGAAFFLTHLRWLCSTTPPGFVLGSLYLAITFPVAAWLIRHLVRRRGLMIALALPIVWVGLELARSRGPLTFPWFLLGHSQIRLPPMIQIADVAGAFGVSFVLAMVNGWLADGVVLLRSRRAGATGRRGGFVLSTVLTVIAVSGTFAYGRYRLNEMGVAPGPFVSVVQGDYPLSTNQANNAGRQEKKLMYARLMREAADDNPDMIILPETPWSMLLNRELRELASSTLLDDLDEQERRAYVGTALGQQAEHEQLKAFAERHRAFLVIGSLSLEKQPEGEYPREHRYNSAFVYAPGEEEPSRYDKIHLVLFGEYVPFRYTKGFFWLYRFLNDGPWNPWGHGGNEYSLTPGKTFTTFEMESRRLDEAFRFGVVICYEDVIPHVFRKFVVNRESDAKQVDFMVNISNDGWFGHGDQQAQHLVASAFRAVENRVAVARAVNTGISGFVRPDGQWYDLAGASRTEPIVGGNGHVTSQLVLDDRVTFYSRRGDLFATICGMLTILVGVECIYSHFRRRARRSRREEMDGG